MFLTLIEWTVKETGEEKAIYAYVNNPVMNVSFSDGMSGSFRPTTKTDVEIAPIWLGDMTDDLFDIYVKKGQDVINFNPKSPADYTYCGDNFQPSSATSTEPAQATA